MRVVLRVLSGSSAGKRMWIFDRQRIHVGRTQWADLVVPDDSQMADVHFRLECDDRLCSVRRVSASLPLYVNGSEAIHRTLIDGDVISAGKTEFGVSIGRTPTPLSSEAGLKYKKAQPESSDGPFYDALTCTSTLVRYRGEFLEKLHPGNLARLLNEHCAMYVIINTKRTSAEIDTKLHGVVDLMDLYPIPDEVLEDQVYLITPRAVIDRYDLIRQCWGDNALTCLFSPLEESVFRMQLARVTSWLSLPGTLRKRLANGVPNMVLDGFKGIQSALLPGESPLEWELFLDARPIPIWKRIGLPQAPVSTENHTVFANTSFSPPQ